MRKLVIEYKCNYNADNSIGPTYTFEVMEENLPDFQKALVNGSDNNTFLEFKEIK